VAHQPADRKKVNFAHPGSGKMKGTTPEILVRAGLLAEILRFCRFKRGRILAGKNA
jgi:hypothetical protein